MLPFAPSSSRANTDVMNVSSLSHGEKAAPKVFLTEFALGVGSRPYTPAKNESKAVKLSCGHG